MTTKKHRNKVARKALISWDRDRKRQLRKRAIAEDRNDREQLAAHARQTEMPPASKAEMRAAAAEAMQAHEHASTGEWVIRCCGQEKIVSVKISEALNTPLVCARCEKERWLSEEDLVPPWD